MDRAELWEAHADMLEDMLPSGGALDGARLTSFDWTACTMSCESLMTRAWEGRLPHHIAVAMQRGPRELAAARWGVDVLDVALAGAQEDVAGLAWWSTSHCVAAFRVGALWYRAPGSQAVPSTETGIRHRAGTASGCAVLLSPVDGLALLPQVQRCLRAGLRTLCCEAEADSAVAASLATGELVVDPPRVAAALRSSCVVGDCLVDALLICRLLIRLHNMSELRPELMFAQRNHALVLSWREEVGVATALRISRLMCRVMWP